MLLHLAAVCGVVLDLYSRWLAHRALGNHDQLAFKAMMTAVNVVEPLQDSNGTDVKHLGKVLGGKVVLGHLPLSRWASAETGSASYGVHEGSQCPSEAPIQIREDLFLVV